MCNEREITFIPQRKEKVGQGETIRKRSVIREETCLKPLPLSLSPFLSPLISSPLFLSCLVCSLDLTILPGRFECRNVSPPQAGATRWVHPIHIWLQLIMLGCGYRATSSSQDASIHILLPIH